MQPDERQPWSGWIRPRGSASWKKLVEGPSYDATMGLLLDATEQSGDYLVLPSGQHPDQQPSKAIAGQQLRHPPGSSAP